MFFGAGSFTVVPSSKSSISCQGIKSLDHLKSLSKNTFAFSDPTQAYLSLAGFSNMLSLKISLRGFSINVFAQLVGPVIMRFLFLPLPWISKSLTLVCFFRSYPRIYWLQTGRCQFHWEKELPWHTVTTDQHNLQHIQNSNVSSLYRFEMLCWLPVFLWLTPFAKFWLQVHGVLFHFIWIQTQQCPSGKQFSTPQQWQGGQSTIWYPLLKWTLLNPGWSNFFASLQEHEKILLLWTSFFGHRQHEILQLTFWLLERQLSKTLVDVFYFELPLGHFYRHNCMQTDINYACH